VQGLKDNPPPYFLSSEQHSVKRFFYPGTTIFQTKSTTPANIAIFRATSTDSTTQHSNVDLSGTTQRTSYGPDWIAGIILLSLLLLSWIRAFFGKYFSQAIQGIANFQFSQKLFNDRNLLLQRVYALLNLNFLLVGALFAFLAFDHFNLHLFHHGPFINYLLLALGIFCIISFKSFSIFVINWLFPKQSLLQEYLYQVQLFYKSLGLLLLPLVLIIAYFSMPIGRNLIWPGIVLIIILFMHRIFRGYKIIIHKDIKLFYLILYFCALEILPVLVLCKFVAQLA
jgi:hypothetical protein